MQLQSEWHCRGRLPHWEAGEAPQSITFRLADSLPRAVLEDVLKFGARAPRPGSLSPAARRARFEALLDAGHGEGLLADGANAAIVEDTLARFDGEKYRLHAWCVMPNHVHVLATPLGATTLSSITHSWKSFSAKAINARLGRTGPLWFEEYFDRAIRDAAHFEAARSYIEENPVKAGLCARAADWGCSSASRSANASPALLESEDAGGAPAVRGLTTPGSPWP